MYQSADKYHNGRITKRGSKVARWILTRIAKATSRKKASKLKEFFNRKKKTIGYQKAIIPLARKIVTIIWHLISSKTMKCMKMKTVIKKEKIKRGTLLRLLKYPLMKKYQ